MPDGHPKTPFDNSYARLPDRFFARLDPHPVRAPRLVRFNGALAAELGLSLDGSDEAMLADIFAGNRMLDGAEPIAMAYAGHQFGGWSPQLGDGRAHLLGEVVGAQGRRDIQLKGSGPTPFSRMGDGRAPLGPVIREYILCEAMAALGVPTTRALAAVATGEPVAREAVLPGGVFTRVAASHIRVGTFQFFGARHDDEGVRLLVDHVIARHFPEIEGDGPARARGLLDAVIARQAALIAQWMSLGFIHGVMNTDNMTVSGETIDYGPCAFMDAFHPETVFSSIDRQGRYAYAMQPKIGHWNLAQFAMALIPLLDPVEETAIEIAKAALDAYPAAFEAAWLLRMRGKLGLSTAEDGDRALSEALLSVMAAASADFTGTFRALTDAAEGEDASLRAALGGGEDAAEWCARWQARLAREAAGGPVRAAEMRSVNPIYIPRNHLVEEAIRAAYEDDFAPFHALVDVLAAPFEEREGLARYAAPPSPDQIVTETFCGT